jgi:hypothetical protein
MVAEVVRISARQLLTTAAHASLALQRVRQLHVGKTAHRALSIVTTRTQVTRASLVQPVLSAAQPLLGTRDATGAQRLLLAAATFSATTVHLAELAKTDLHALLTVTHARHDHSIATHVRLAMAQHLVVSKTVQLELLTAMLVHLVIHAMVEHLVVSKTVRPELLTATHAQLAKTAHHALSIAMLVLRASSKTAHRALSIAQNHADHASSMTALASSTATTATTAPTVAQTALTA